MKILAEKIEHFQAASELIDGIPKDCKDAVEMVDATNLGSGLLMVRFSLSCGVANLVGEVYEIRQFEGQLTVESRYNGKRVIWYATCPDGITYKINISK